MSPADLDTMTEDFSSIVQVPAPRASIDAIAEFSHTYDAYGVHGSLERISIVASRVWEARATGSLADCGLDDLRTALFMTQRGWHLDGAIVEFSHTFDAYGVHGSLERISIVANRVWEARATGSLADCGLDDLRTALFMTQRGWHLDGAIVETDIGIEWELIEAIDEASGGFVRDDRPILL